MKQNPFYDFEDIFETIKLNKAAPLKTIVVMTKTSGRTHLDVTGVFKYSDKSVEYDLIFYCEDANYVHREPLLSLSDAGYTLAIQNGIDFPVRII